MPPTDPRAYQGLEPGFRNRVEQWIAAGGGRFWLPVGGGLRSTERQRQLYIDHCGSLSAPTSACRPPTARPGTSRHEIGQAVDITGDKAYAAQLAPQFGLEPLKNRAGRVIEDWHFQAIGGTTTVQNDRVFTDDEGRPLPDWMQRLGNQALNGADSDNPCLLSLPAIGLPGGSLPLIPDQLGGQCLLRQSHGRALLGAFCLTTGTIITVVGIILLAGKSIAVPNVGRVPGLNGQRIEPERLPMWVTDKTVTYETPNDPEVPAVVETTRQVRRKAYA